MNEQETIVDIIAEKRREADYIEETARGSLKAGENYDGIAYTESDLESALDLADTKRKEADRLKAALRRERGDCAKLRESVKAVVDVGYPHNFQKEAPHIRGYCYDITRAIDKCFAALAAPARNCDVGTAEEQAERESLRNEYRAAMRASLEGNLSNTYIQYPDGTKKKVERKD